LHHRLIPHRTRLQTKLGEAEAKKLKSALPIFLMRTLRGNCQLRFSAIPARFVARFKDI